MSVKTKKEKAVLVSKSQKSFFTSKSKEVLQTFNVWEKNKKNAFQLSAETLTKIKKYKARLKKKG